MSQQPANETKKIVNSADFIKKNLSTLEGNGDFLIVVKAFWQKQSEPTSAIKDVKTIFPLQSWPSLIKKGLVELPIKQDEKNLITVSWEFINEYVKASKTFLTAHEQVFTMKEGKVYTPATTTAPTGKTYLLPNYPELVPAEKQAELIACEYDDLKDLTAKEFKAAAEKYHPLAYKALVDLWNVNHKEAQIKL